MGGGDQEHQEAAQESEAQEVSETLTYKVWKDKVTATDPDAKERGIRQDGVRDWRDGDRVIELNGFQVQSKDSEYRAHHGGIEPDWSLGWALTDPSNFSRTVFEGTGEPPDWIAQALREGRRVYGCIILRDEQQHG